MKILQRITRWFKPTSIYILVAYDEESGNFSEIIPISSLAAARQVQTVLQATYGGRNVAMASRYIDDVPYMIKRRLLVKEAVQTALQGAKTK